MQVVPSPVVLQVVISPPTSPLAPLAVTAVQPETFSSLLTVNSPPLVMAPTPSSSSPLVAAAVTAVPSPQMHPPTPPVLMLSSHLAASVADSGDGGAGGSASNVSGSISGIIVTKGDGSIGLNAQSVGGGGGAAGSVTNSASASGKASVAGSATLSFGGSGGDGGSAVRRHASRFPIQLLRHSAPEIIDTRARLWSSRRSSSNPSVVVVVKLDPSCPAMSPTQLLPQPTDFTSWRICCFWWRRWWWWQRQDSGSLGTDRPQGGIGGLDIKPPLR